MTKLYISYYGDYVSIVEGGYKATKDKYNIKNIEIFSLNDIEEGYSKEKYFLLKHALENTKFKSKHVVFCLNTRDVILKPYKLPKVSKKDLEGIMNLEIDDIMSLDKNNYIFSYEVAKESIEDGNENLDLIIGAVKKDEIKSIVDILHKFKFNIDRIGTITAAYLRFLKTIDYEDILVANVGDSSTIINIYKNDSLFIYDNIPIKMSIEDMDNKIFSVVEEAKGLMNYYSSRNFGKTTETILVLGKRHHNKSIYETFNNSFSSRIAQGITDIIDVDEFIVGNFKKNEINLITEHLGCMIDPKNKKEYDNINLLPSNVRYKQEKIKGIKKFIKFIPSLFLVALIPYTYLTEMNKLEQNKLKNIESEIYIIEETYNKIGGIKSEIKSKEEELNIYDMLNNKEIKWGNLLTDIDKNTPTKVQLVNLAAEYEVKVENEKRKDYNQESVQEKINDEIRLDKENKKNDENDVREVPIYNQIPNILKIEGRAKDASYVGQFIYNLKSLSYFDNVDLHKISEQNESSQYEFSMTLYLKEGVLNNE